MTKCCCGYQTFSFLQWEALFLLTFPFFWFKIPTFFNIWFEPRLPCNYKPFYRIRIWLLKILTRQEFGSQLLLQVGNLVNQFGRTTTMRKGQAEN